METKVIIINKNTGCNMHGIHQNQAVTDAAFFEALFDLRGDVDKAASCG